MDTPLDSWLLNQIMKWIQQIEIIIFLCHLKPLTEETWVIKEIRFKGLHGPNP